MPVYALGGLVPVIDATAYVHPDAVIIGAVTIGAESSVWPTAVLRADASRIEVGARTSVQDGTVVHCTPELPTLIGSDCVVGHNAHLEGCVVEDGCLVGSGSVLLHRVLVRTGALVAAGAVVAPGTDVPAGSTAMGIPPGSARTRSTPRRSGRAWRPTSWPRPATAASCAASTDRFTSRIVVDDPVKGPICPI